MLRTAFLFVFRTIILLSVCVVPVSAKQIIISGSTSVARIMDVLADDYNKNHPDTYIAVQAVGSTAGLALLNKGVVSIAMLSRYLTESELKPSIHVDLLAYDGLAIVVNPSNPVHDLSREQLYHIFKGQTTNWKEVGGSDQKIIAVTREASSGTRFSFESMVGLTKVVNDRLVSDINPSHLVVNSNSMMKTLIHHNPQAIGFISTGSVDNSIKAVTFEGLNGTPKNISNGNYQLSRPFLLVTYPARSDPDTNAFMNYLKSDHVRKLILKFGYIPTIK